MQFHLDFPIAPLQPPAKYGQQYLLMGSCFAGEIGHYLKQYKFDVEINPHGILYNPLSITTALRSYLDQHDYTKEDLFFYQGLWHSWDHHGMFSHPDPDICLEWINASRQRGYTQLMKADWLILTLGSAHVFELKDTQRIVGNCHKMPADNFEKKLLKPEQVITALDNLLHPLFAANKKVRILFTISPVRYIRDGMAQSNLSKSILLYATHHLVNKFDRLHYFPAYEIVTDDLRDYRFYKEDLVHPNTIAINYVWEKFIQHAMDKETQDIMEEVRGILDAVAHRPLHPGSQAYRRFAGVQLQKIARLSQQHPLLDFTTEAQVFTGIIGPD